MLAKAAMQDDVSALTRAVTAEVAGASGSAADQIAAWRDRNRRALERSGQLFSELRAVPAPDAAMLSVALRELRSLA
jgi:glutamate dehydrogenase